MTPPQAPEPVERREAAPGSGLHFRVYGTPAPQGSKRHVGGGRMIESSKAVKPWREAVKYAARDAIDALPNADDYWRLVAVPVDVIVDFYLPRPKHHFRTGQNAHLIRDAAPARPTTKPDLDKLVRSTLDALGEADVWRDDSQVVAVHATKFYGRPGAGITIRALS